MNLNPNIDDLWLVRTENINSIKIKHYETQVDGLKVHWVAAGEGKPVIFLHTLFGSWDHFKPAIPSFADEFKVIIPDLPGLGPKGNENELPYPHTLKGYSLFLNNFSQVLGLKKFHLVGSSLGGLISLKFATDNPEKLKSLTLQGIPTDFHPLIKRFTRLLLFPLNAKLFGILPFGIFYLIMKKDPNLEGTEEEKLVWARRAKQSSFRAFAEATHSIVHTKLEEEASKLAIPTLLIDGYDAVWPAREDTKKFAQVIPNCRGPVFIYDAGHNVAREKPGKFAQVVKNFFRSSKPQLALTYS